MASSTGTYVIGLGVVGQSGRRPIGLFVLLVTRPPVISDVFLKTTNISFLRRRNVGDDLEGPQSPGR